MLYEFINGKIKLKEAIERMRKEHGIIDSPKSMVNLLATDFIKFLAKNPNFRSCRIVRSVHFGEFRIIKSVYKLMEELEEGKVMGLDEILGSIMRASYTSQVKFETSCNPRLISLILTNPAYALMLSSFIYPQLHPCLFHC